MNREKNGGGANGWASKNLGAMAHPGPPLGLTLYPSGSKKHLKAKEAKMREEEVTAKSRNIQVTILQWQ